LETLGLINSKSEKGLVKFTSSSESKNQISLMKKLFDSFNPL